MINWAQMKRYRAIWKDAKNALASGGFDDEEIEEKRFDIHEEICGVRCSSKDLKEWQYSKVCAAFKAISEPSNLDAQIDGLNHGRNTRIWWLQNCQLPGGYLAKVCRDRHGTEDWKNLGDVELEQFHMTIKARAKKHSKKRAEAAE